MWSSTHSSTHFQQILSKTAKSSSMKALDAELLSLDSSSLANSMVDMALFLNCCTAFTGITGGGSSFLNAPYCWLVGEAGLGDVVSGLTSSLMSFMKLSSSEELPWKSECFILSIYVYHIISMQTQQYPMCIIHVCCVCVCMCVVCLCVCSRDYWWLVWDIMWYTAHMIC